MFDFTSFKKICNNDSATFRCYSSYMVALINVDFS